MASEMDFPATGKVAGVKNGLVIFRPSNTNYELHLASAGGPYAGPVDAFVKGWVRVNARKVWTVPSGGNFISPIFGTPRIVQGRVRFASDTTLVVQAGAPVIVTLPADPAAIDLVNGPIAPNMLVNVTVLPGATFELAQQAAVK